MNLQDPLEFELRELRPRAASAEWKRRIVERLEGPSPRAAQRSWGVALAGALAAACLAAIGLWRSDLRDGTNENGVSSRAVSPTDFDPPPTVLAYRHALVRSAEHFDALLDRHSMVTLPHDPARNGVRAFIRPVTQHPSWRGEL
jgi:hypothetical protein